MPDETDLTEIGATAPHQCSVCGAATEWLLRQRLYLGLVDWRRCSACDLVYCPSEPTDDTERDTNSETD